MLCDSFIVVVSITFAIGPLRAPVTWYGINYAGTQVTQELVPVQHDFPYWPLCASQKAKGGGKEIDCRHCMFLPQCCVTSFQQVTQMCATVVLTVIHSQILHACNPRVRQNMLRKQQPNSYYYFKGQVNILSFKLVHKQLLCNNCFS